MKRRSFLQGLLLVAGAAIVPEFPQLPSMLQGRSPSLAVEGWEYDAPSGSFRNPGLTEYVRNRASRRGGFHWKEARGIPPQAEVWRESSGVWRAKRNGAAEYARGYAVTNIRDGWYLQTMVKQLTEVNKARLAWYLIPELRATIPANFGRTQMVVWYGVAKA